MLYSGRVLPRRFLRENSAPLKINPLQKLVVAKIREPLYSYYRPAKQRILPTRFLVMNYYKMLSYRRQTALQGAL